MRYWPAALVVAGLFVLVLVNAGSLRRALETGGTILVVVAGLLLLAALFAWFITRPTL